MSDLVKRLRDFTKSEIVRIDAADRIEALEAALRQAQLYLQGEALPTKTGLSATINDLLNDTPEKQK
jgi:hypothetical protein